MNNDLRQQILVSLRAEGVGEADRAREALAGVNAAIRTLAQGFGEGTVTADDFRRGVGALAGQFNFFNGIVKESESRLQAIDVGLHTLQATALKFADAYEASMARAAAASEAAELKEAERLAKLAADYEQFLARRDAAAEAAELAEAERLAKLAADYEQSQARREAAAAKAELAEAERLAKMAADYERAMARQDAAAEAAELAEAERVAKLVAAHEQAMARQGAADEAAELKEAERLARLAAQHEQYLQRERAAEEAAELAEAERLAKLAAEHEKYLEREAAAERKNAAEIAAARASLNQQRRDTLEAAAGNLQNEILATQRTFAGLGTVMDHSHDKANRYGLAVLNVSHAFQDLQYGMAAALNNIPLITTSLGFGPGVAGAVMAAGVAIELLRGQVGDLGVALGYAEDPIRKVGSSIDEVKKKIEAIESKTFKFAVDYKDLDEAEARLARLVKLKGLVEGTAETKTEKTFSQVAQDIATGPAGGSDALSKAVGDIEATRGVEHGSPVDINIVRNANRMIDMLRRRQATENPISAWVTGKIIADMERRRDASQRNIEGARAGFVQEEVGAFLAGESGAVARMKGRVAEFPGAFTKAGGEAIASMPGSAEEMAATEARNLAARQAVGLDIANRADFDKWKKADDAARKKKAADARRAATERQQEIDRQAALFGGEFDDVRGPGSLDAAILNRATAGRTAAQIQGELGGQMRTQLAGKVADDMVGEVADAIVKRAVDKVRAEVAAAGGGPAGVAAVVDERIDKLDRTAQAGVNRQRAAANRAAREDATGFEQALAGEMMSAAGGRLNPQGALAAAKDAVRNMREGQGMQQAAWNALFSTLEELQRDAADFRAGMMGVNHRLNGVGAAGRRQRAQRPPVGNTFAW
jgi:hypothetical protein